MEKELLSLEKCLLKTSENYITEELQDIIVDFESRMNLLRKVKNQLIFNIIISNYSKKNLDILKEEFTDILREQKIVSGDIIEYNNNLNLQSIPSNSLIILDGLDEFKEKNYNYQSKMKNLYNKNIHFLFCTTNYHDKEKIEEELGSTHNLYFEGKKVEKVSILKEIKELYKNIAVSLKIDDIFLEKVIDSYLKDNPHENILLATKIVDSSLEQMIILNKEEITEECFSINNEDKKYIVELNKMVGLLNVKKDIQDLTNFLEFRKKLKDFDKMYLNLFFMGNAGTGKTTIARIYTHILYELGFIKEDKIVEIVPNDLMGNYVGQTKDTTREILDKAKNGVLFIDEAYLINQSTYLDGFSSYMKEAVVELLKYLEDPNNVVIFSGYANEMKQIYEVNPGIKSRIYKEIYFDDYTNQELYSILENNLEKIGMKIELDAKQEILNIFEKERQKVNFGNARFIEKYMQMILINHANRKLKKETFKIGKKDILISNYQELNGFFKESI